ncbi:helix-turn-helix transcriptional regulator [Actinophytocola sp.]|uniref:helix-turn-helix transcriptional regulator n=1 Tax=Actinophytocola sp. TaxID=1872138 RepID=UPI002D7FC178|nr:AAA family ATPase [Actinophytocola sp.]HET9139501.1 AAA family ATPase [Actinophytocola sp.]
MSNDTMPLRAKAAGSAGASPLVGRDAALRTFDDVVEAAHAGEFQFLAVVGEPGVGKTRLLAELTGLTGRYGLTTLRGRAAEFEQIMPFSALIDALDDHLEARAETVQRLGVPQQRLLATVFPALAARIPGAEPDENADRSGIVRLQLYRAVRKLVDELAQPHGLALILDDVHWADPASAEFLDHLVRHAPRGRVLVAVAYRPAQAPPRVAALVGTAGGHQITVDPLNSAEVAELLGPGVNRARGRALYEASGGNPFYLEALSRMEVDELPASARAVLQVELDALPPGSLRLAQAAAVTGDEFEPALVAVAAEASEPELLDGLDDLVARDILRPAGTGRFQFRHPLVRQAAYEYAEAGWRLGAHARLAAQLADAGAPATVQAHHVERSSSFGDTRAVTTLVTAARAVADHAPETGAHWLRKALDLIAVEPETLEYRLELLMELCRAEGVSGRLADGRDTARELLRLLPAGQHARRARAARICALMERQLDRPLEARALLLDELNRMPNPRAAAAIPLRMRLVAESLMRVDFRAAQAVLDLMPDSDDGWEPGLAVAVAALRAMPAYAGGRMADAVRRADNAERVLDAAPDAHLAEWLDAIAWLCWTGTCLGRYPTALRNFERAAGVARSTGQTYVLTNLLAGKGRTLIALGRLPEAMDIIDESVEGARLLQSGQQLVFALTQLCLALAWSGEHEAALRAGQEAVAAVGGSSEVWSYMGRNALGVALVLAGRLDEGVDALVETCADFDNPRLDRATLLATCELLAQAESARGRHAEAGQWAGRAAALDYPELPVFAGLVPLARAHVVHAEDPGAAAALAEDAAVRLRAGQRSLDAGRALLLAGLAHKAAGRSGQARERLREATETFQACGARALEAQAVRERRRLGDRVPAPAAAGQGDAPFGLSPRELQVAKLVVQGLTNQRIAEELSLSVRTVETHLSRAFTKLGVDSRVGVAIKLARDE